jgi:hypothetical protein
MRKVSQPRWSAGQRHDVDDSAMSEDGSGKLRHGAGSQGGGFFRRRQDMPTEIANEVGGEAAETARRSMGLRRNLRPLTDAARGQLHDDLAPVLNDIRATGAIVPEIREEEHKDLGQDMVSAWLQGPDGVTGMGLRVNMALPAADRLADVADQFQEWEVEELAAAGRSATWPECPEHPKSHPLSPQVRDGAAVWSCPRNGQVEYPIGGMTTPPSPGI